MGYGIARHGHGHAVYARQLMRQLLSRRGARTVSLATPVPCWTCVADIRDECMDCLDVLGAEVSLVTQRYLEFIAGSRKRLVARHVYDLEAKCGPELGYGDQCGRCRVGENLRDPPRGDAGSSSQLALAPVAP